MLLSLSSPTNIWSKVVGVTKVFADIAVDSKSADSAVPVIVRFTSFVSVTLAIGARFAIAWVVTVLITSEAEVSCIITLSSVATVAVIIERPFIFSCALISFLTSRVEVLEIIDLPKDVHAISSTSPDKAVERPNNLSVLIFCIFAKVTTSLSIVQVAPEADTVISPLSPSETPPVARSAILWAVTCFRLLESFISAINTRSPVATVAALLPVIKAGCAVSAVSPVTSPVWVAFVTFAVFSAIALSIVFTLSLIAFLDGAIVVTPFQEVSSYAVSEIFAAWSAESANAPWAVVATAKSPAPKRVVEFTVLMFVPDTRVACFAFNWVCMALVAPFT